MTIGQKKLFVIFAVFFVLFGAFKIFALSNSRTIYAIATGKDGSLYVGGNLVDSKGNYYLAKYKDGQETKIYGFKSFITHIAVGNDDSLYISSGNYIFFHYKDGKLKPVKTLNGYIANIVVGRDGSVYLGGGFTDKNDFYVAQYKDGQWNNIGTFGRAEINVLALGRNGSIYVDQGYPGPEETPYFDILRGNIRNPQPKWPDIGGAFNYTPSNIAAKNDGTLYVGGLFTDSSDKHYIAQYKDGKWNSIGTFNGEICALAIMSDGSLCATGDFTGFWGRRCVDQYQNGNWASIGGAFNNTIFALTPGSDDTLYAGGLATDKLGNISVFQYKNEKWKSMFVP